jgi:hypothetical protein
VNAVLRTAGLLALASTPAAAQPARGGAEGTVVVRGQEEGGEHWRLETSNGPVHLWRPADYRPEGAGLVVYVHGYFETVDDVWRDHGLARQFADSHENALFVVPAAPIREAEPVHWPRLDELLAAVRTAGIDVPAAPLVVIGHSGAFRTILGWLDDSRLRHLILLDALYGPPGPFHAFLRAGRSTSARLVLVGNETARRSERFARRYRSAARKPAIPESPESFTPRDRAAPLLYLRSQYEHMEIVLSGRVIPLLLSLMPLPRL